MSPTRIPYSLTQLESLKTVRYHLRTDGSSTCRRSQLTANHRARDLFRALATLGLPQLIPLIPGSRDIGFSRAARIQTVAGKPMLAREHDQRVSLRS